MSTETILLADDDAAIRMVLTRALTSAGFDVRPTGNFSTLWNWVSRGDGELVISDVTMPDGNAFDVLPKIKKARPDLPIVVISAQNTFMTAIRASEIGAYEYLPKPFDLGEITAICARAIAEVRKAEKPKQQATEAETMPFVGRSSAMQDIYRALARLMQTELTVMISGESGTGKELVAQALHDFGKRRKGPFVAINMAAIPKDLIEAELFGHEKGAFTGATNRASGRFEQAEGGTLFLDEIGDMPMEAQTRLLRVLQEGEYTMVGGRTPIKANVRIVAATHRDLGQMIRQGLFREDLFYRLNVVPVALPPLRDRSEDIADLATHFLNTQASGQEVRKSLSDAAIERLRQHTWPGNVRELENLILRLDALYPDETISAEMVHNELGSSTPMLRDKPNEGDLEGALDGLAFALIEADRTADAKGNVYQNYVDVVEHPLIAAALNVTGGNQIKSAELLGMNRNTLRKKIARLGIEVVRKSWRG